MTNDPAIRRRRLDARARHNAEFYERLRTRRPKAEEALDELTKRITVEAVAPVAAAEVALETLVRQERPVLFVQDDWINHKEVTIKGVEARELIDLVETNQASLQPLIPLIGRIDVTHFPGSDYLGTGWFIGPDIVVTNRHVASLIARWDGRRFVFRRGVASRAIEGALGTSHEFDDTQSDPARSFAVTEVLYIEGESGPDIAFLRVRRRPDGTIPSHISIADTDAGDNVPVLVVGYPARAPKSVIPDQDLMQELFRGRFDVKRAAPGYTMAPKDGATRHDCTTLGGNSGSVVLDLKSGKALGLHFAGLYQESNYAVRASVLARYVREERWRRAPLLDLVPTERPVAATPTAAATTNQVPQTVMLADGSATLTVPLTVTVRLGSPTDSSSPSTQRPTDPDLAETLVSRFWEQRPDGVVAARLGFKEDNGQIGDAPFIAASVPAEQLASAQATAPSQFGGLEVRYFAADAAELLDGLPGLESVDHVAYDNEARTGADFSFDTVEEEMMVRAHVGPEYSWDVLSTFLRGAKKRLVSAMYEFHGAHIAKALKERIDKGTNLVLVLDNATFSKVRDSDEEFDRIATFDEWKELGRFKRIVAPEGTDGLISDSYHIKVTVREDDNFWLSSGNWKMHSSQPVISEEQREQAADVDLPGNREWHVVVDNATLAKRFRSHILQDFVRSKDLGGGEVPRSKEAPELFVDVPVEPLVERRPPGRILKPKEFSGRIRVKPLLTPDDDGAVYSEAVLDLIRGARESLLFQIPYIGMPSNPRADRGFIDELIRALTQKLKVLDDARVILRTGGSAYSSPAHAAWYFKGKGVDINERVRQLPDHHTKGMIVDGRRVLLGSHNWSKPGVSLNRDASLLFDHEGIATYYAEAFEIDWARASRVTPKRYIKQEGTPHAVGEAPEGFRRVRLEDLSREQD